MTILVDMAPHFKHPGTSPLCSLKDRFGVFQGYLNNNVHMPIHTLKVLLVTVIIPPVHTAVITYHDKKTLD